MRRTSLRSATTPRWTPTRTRITAALGGLALAGAALVGLAPAAQAASAHSPKGSIDSLSFTNGKVSVIGWTLDPDAGAAIKVKIVVDGKAKVSTLANRKRTDVGARFPRYGNFHGFAGSFTANNGQHTVCAVAQNVKSGSNTVIGCGKVTVNNNPVGGLNPLTQGPTGVLVAGWSVDPNTTKSVQLDVRVDGHKLRRITANKAGTPTGIWKLYGNHHGFSTVASLSTGTHQVCIYGVNVGLGKTAVKITCKSIKVIHDPTGTVAVARPTGSLTTATVSGWTYDPDSTRSLTISVSVDGAPAATGVVAATVVPGLTAVNPAIGTAHGFSVTVPGVDANQHQICVSATNVGAGADAQIGCGTLLSTGDLTPSQPNQATAWPGSKQATVTWLPARAISSAVTGYVVSGLPGHAPLTLAATATQALIKGLVNGRTYTFTVVAQNALGAGSSVTVTAQPSNVPPQFSAAPISTSHYPRNWTGNLTADSAAARAQGAADAAANPSNHRYLILQDIGGQDQGRGGVLLSATSKYFSYAYTVSVMEAYSDGYAASQKIYAPLILAIGTNNDVDVSAGAGQAWATQVVNPLRSYVTAHHPGIEVAGANDIEPGFSAGVTASRAWLSGYLTSTSARFIFNGSADGCSTTTWGRGCNNGWSASDLQWLSGGAAPDRILSLPQIYNGAMPLQWKYISLTGVINSQPKINFGGTLTEWTACSVSRCFSIGGNSAWNQLWAAISSDSRTRQYDLPFSTDLKIN